MRIDEHWCQILGRHGGIALSDPRDCNVFALRTSAGLIAFDSGGGLGAPLTGISHLFLTHGHADHAGGAAAMVAASGCRVLAGAETARWLADPDEAALSLPAARAAGVYPSNYALRPVATDQVLADGERVRVGEADILAIQTPGHSADHFSYLVTAFGRRTLVAGDALFADGTIILQDTWDSTVAASCATIRKFAALSFDTLLAGHGPPRLGDGAAAVTIAMERINRLLPPLNYL